MALAYETRGDGRPLVVLPWFGLDHGSVVAAFEPVFAGRPGWRRIYVDLPGTGASPGGEPPDGWLDGVEPDLAGHLATALGRRTAAVAERVAAVVAATQTGDDEFLDRLRPAGYRLSDEGAAVPYPGPTALLAGRQDLVAGYADQFAALEHYPDGTYAVVPEAGHYLPFEQPDVFAELTGQWLARLG